MFGMFLAIERIAYDRAVLFAELAAVSGQVGATRSRSAKVEALAECLRALADDAESEALAAGVCFLAGRLRQGRLGVGPAAVRRLSELPAAATSSLTVGDIDRALAEFERQRPRRVDRLQPLVRGASADERDYLLRLLIGEVRQGALDGLLVDAIATAAEAPLDRVRRALMVSGDLPAVAEAALRVGVDGLHAFQLQVFQPVEPMLAQSAPSVAEALERTGAAAVEAKLDGMRVQIHRDGDVVRVFTRSLRDVTAGVPAAVAAARRLSARSVVVDGEAIALGAGGRPRPFQETMSGAGRASIFLFDCLLLDGRDLTGEPWSERRQALTGICPAELLVDAIETGDPDEAQRFVDKTLRVGHEGVVVKSVDEHVRGGPAGSCLDKGQAGADARPGGAGRRMGLRPPRR